VYKDRFITILQKEAISSLTVRKEITLTKESKFFGRSTYSENLHFYSFMNVLMIIRYFKKYIDIVEINFYGTL